MKKIIQRLMMFIIGLPAVLMIVIALPHMHHLAANIVLAIMGALGALEFAGILGKGNYRLPSWEAALLGSLMPLAGMLTVSFGMEKGIVLAVFMSGVGWVISSRIFAKAADLGPMVDRTAAGLAVLIYPGVFLLWIVRMTSLDHATSVLLVFLLTVFANDSLAWFFGILFGKGNRGFISASPNKSIVGFIAGMAASVTVGMDAV
jgi:phosphatidate cytidylyltransferase